MRKWQRRLTPYLFISPFFIGYAIFFIYPVIYAFYLSFFRQVGIGSAPMFVGLDNYLKLFDDPKFVKSVFNTSYYAVGSVLVIIPAALALALSLNVRRLPLSSFFRFFFFSPLITSGVVVAIIFRLVFDERYGLLNSLFVTPFGAPPVGWLLTPALVIPSIILLGLWRWTGVNALYFLVGLQNIPQELLEASALDGATRWQTFRHVTLPLLRPVLLFVTILAIVGSYNLFAEPFLLTDAEGGTRNSGLFMTMYLYLNAFRFLKFGYASAIGYAMTVIILVLSLIQLKLMGVFRED